MKPAASSYRPSSSRPAITWSRCENSCSCARSASARLRTSLQLAQQPLELRAVAEGHDRADVASAHRHRHPVRDEHAVVDEHDLVRPVDRALDDVAHVPGRHGLGKGPSDD